MKFWESVFSDNGSGSASRILTGIHSLSACVCLIYVTHVNHALPNSDVMLGLGGFATVHYAVNQLRNAFGK